MAEHPDGHRRQHQNRVVPCADVPSVGILLRAQNPSPLQRCHRAGAGGAGFQRVRMLLRSIGSAALWLTSWCCGAGVWACVVWCGVVQVCNRWVGFGRLDRAGCSGRCHACWRLGGQSRLRCCHRAKGEGVGHVLQTNRHVDSQQNVALQLLLSPTQLEGSPLVQ